jgi:hypothetical protein
MQEEKLDPAAPSAKLDQQQHASTEREKSLALEPTAREKWYEHRSPWKLKMSPSEKTWGGSTVMLLLLRHFSESQTIEVNLLL